MSPACGFELPPQLLDVFLGLGLCFTPDRFLALPETRPFKVSTGKRTQGSPTAEAVKGKLKELYWSYTPVYSELHVCVCNGAARWFPAEQRALRYTIQVFVCVLVKGEGKEN